MTGHSAVVTGMALHPTNRRQLLTSSLDGTLRAWDADDGACLRTMQLGAAIVRLASPSRWPVAARPVVYVVLLGEGADAGAYPVGNEVACLRPRPLAAAFAFTVDDAGRRLEPPRSLILEVDLSPTPKGQRPATHPVSTANGFVTGIEAVALSSPHGKEAEGVGAGGDTARAIVWTSRSKVSVCTAAADAPFSAATSYKHGEHLTTLSIHPSATAPYVTTGDTFGRMRTWHLPELQCPPESAQVQLQHASPASTSRKRPRAAEAAATPDVPSTTVQWHAHSVWATSFTPDGGLLLSGGEEGVVVLWKLPSAGAEPGAFGPPSGDRKTSMTFLPRMGGAIQAIAAYAAGAAEADAASRGGGGGAVRDSPPLLFAVVTRDNAVAVVDGVSMRELWRVSGVAIEGSPAIVPRGVAISLQRYALRAAHRAGLDVAKLKTDAAATEDGARLPHTLVHLPGDEGTLLSAGSRYLRKGLVIDPRGK